MSENIRNFQICIDQFHIMPIRLQTSPLAIATVSSFPQPGTGTSNFDVVAIVWVDPNGIDAANITLILPQMLRAGILPLLDGVLGICLILHKKQKNSGLLRVFRHLYISLKPKFLSYDAYFGSSNYF